MRISLLLILLLFFWLADVLFAQAAAAKLGKSAPIWNQDGLYRVPKTYQPPDVFTKKFLDHLAQNGIRPVWYEGEPYQGKPTRIFAWLGTPPHKPGEKLPAMVLVHGGGGTANWRWVEHWTKRGYAALAMDHGGYLPVKGPDHIRNDKGRIMNRRTEFSGPKPYGFDGLGLPVRDQWPYHAVASVVLGHSLLRSRDDVDPERTGLIGVSWGGYLACLSAGVDDRFACAISVYGCGFLHERSVWAEREIKELPPEQRRRWSELWDPSTQLARVNTPMLWVTGTNDFAYWMPSLMKSARLVQGPVTLAVRVRMRHGHAGGWEPKENFVFAASHLKGGTPLPTLTSQSYQDGHLVLRFTSAIPVVKAELNFTTETNRWPDRTWQSMPARLDTDGGTVTAELPDRTAACFVNLYDERGCVVSSEMVTPGEDQSTEPERKSATR